jgi:hypothetical protein
MAKRVGIKYQMDYQRGAEMGLVFVVVEFFIVEVVVEIFVDGIDIHIEYGITEGIDLDVYVWALRGRFGSFFARIDGLDFVIVHHGLCDLC